MKDLEKTGQDWLRPIGETAKAASIPPGALIPFGRHMAKLDASVMDGLPGAPASRLILVTAMSPTPYGEGKTTLSIGLAQSMRLLGKRAIACIRQPSLGPLLGVKGGGMGSGRAEAGPMEELSLQFNGDDYAVVTAHNLISAIIDNHIYHGNRLSIERVVWPRVATINDRALRTIVTEGGSTARSRKDEFQISAASEIMSILCLSDGIRDLRERVDRTIVAFSRGGSPVTVADLGVAGAVSAILKNAINPNLGQSIEGSPVLIHTGPFGNISIGCSSVSATRLALKLSEYVITEAGFSTELGAEKFMDIVCRRSGFFPSAAVIVATLGALRLHGGASDFTAPDMAAVERGMDNLSKHIENMGAFGVPSIVALNRFKADSDEEIAAALGLIRALGARAVETNVREGGAPGGVEAARALMEISAGAPAPRYLYPLEMPIEDKINTIARAMYGADGAEFTEDARREMDEAQRLGLGGLPVCVAKTPKSLSDDGARPGRPSGFSIKVTGLRPASGAGYLVALCGNILLMPGMPERPLAERIGLDASGRVSGI